MVVAVELRPLGVGEKLYAAFSLYRRNFGTLIAIVAVIVIPIQILAVIVGTVFSSEELPVDPETGLTDLTAIDASFIAGFVATALLLALISFIGTLLATAGVMKAIADDYLGEPPNWQDSLRFAFSKIGPLVAGMLLFALGVIGVFIAGTIGTVILALIAGPLALIGIIALFVFAVILVISWSIWVPAVVVENMSGAKALTRSNQLVKRRRWPVLGFLLVVYLIVGLVSFAAGAVLILLIPSESTAAESIVHTVLAILTTPFIAGAIVVLYFDQRVRVEAFDVDLLASQISGTPLPQAPIPKEFGSLDGEEPPESPQAFPPTDQG